MTGTIWLSCVRGGWDLNCLLGEHHASDKSCTCGCVVGVLMELKYYRFSTVTFSLCILKTQRGGGGRKEGKTEGREEERKEGSGWGREGGRTGSKQWSSCYNFWRSPWYLPSQHCIQQKVSYSDEVIKWRIMHKPVGTWLMKDKEVPRRCERPLSLDTEGAFLSRVWRSRCQNPERGSPLGQLAWSRAKTAEGITGVTLLPPLWMCCQ